jgi:hypothetical protein
MPPDPVEDFQQLDAPEKAKFTAVTSTVAAGGEPPPGLEELLGVRYPAA